MTQQHSREKSSTATKNRKALSPDYVVLDVRRSPPHCAWHGALPQLEKPLAKSRRKGSARTSVRPRRKPSFNLNRALGACGEFRFPRQLLPKLERSRAVARGLSVIRQECKSHLSSTTAPEWSPVPQPLRKSASSCTAILRRESGTANGAEGGRVRPQASPAVDCTVRAPERMSELGPACVETR